MYTKTLKFRPHLCDQIMSGEKTATWRLLDDKDLTVGDGIHFMNSETQEVFGFGLRAAIKTKTLGTIGEADWDGHERYPSQDAMYAEYKNYYGDTVGPETELKIIDFTLKAR